MTLDIQDKQFITSTINDAVTNGVIGLRGEFKDGLQGLGGEFKDGLQGLRGEFKADFQDVRSEFRGELQVLGSEFKSDLQGIRNEFKGDLQDVRTEFKGLFNDFSTKLTEDMERHTGVLKEHFEHKLDMVIELVKDKPGQEEVREIVREETRYIVRDEIQNEMRHLFVPHIKEIRTTQNNHEKRISKLETALI